MVTSDPSSESSSDPYEDAPEVLDHTATFAAPIEFADDRVTAEAAVMLIGWRRVEEVTRADIRRVHREVGRTTDRISAANETLEVLRDMFRLAIRKGWRSDNPCDGVRPLLGGS